MNRCESYHLPRPCFASRMWALLCGVFVGSMIAIGAEEQAQDEGNAQNKEVPPFGLAIEGEWKRMLDPQDRGKKEEWHSPKLDEKEWTSADPAQNLLQNGKDYNGVAWFRKTVRVPEDWKEQPLALWLPDIDDTDEAYLNGVLIGTGTHGLPRNYGIPAEAVNYGNENVIAVRVTDKGGSGGFGKGEIRLGPVPAVPEPERKDILIDLSGMWRFRPDRGAKDEGQAHDDWESEKLDDSDWGALRIGFPWEQQRYNYNGVAWYRRTLTIPRQWNGSALGLFLGQPDDKAEVYFNGESLDKTSKFGQTLSCVVPEKIIRFGRENVIAIRVWDWYKSGGIHGEEFRLERIPDKLRKTVNIGGFERGREGWDYYGGWEFKGAEGQAEPTRAERKKGASSLHLHGDFTKGGVYVSASRKTDKDGADACQMSFWIKSPDLRSIGLRLCDGAGQMFQMSVPLKDTEQWQEVFVPHFGYGNDVGVISGKTDGRWHGPLQSVAFCIGPDEDKKSEVFIDEIELHIE